MKKLNSTFRRAVHCGLLGLAVTLLAGAGDPTARFKDIGSRLMCTCGSCGDTAVSCNHIGCSVSDGMRNELMAAVTRGDSDSLVEQAFVQKYGPTVLAAPTGRGFDRTAWIMPFAVLFLGFGLVVYIVRIWKNRPAPAIADGVAPIHGIELENFRDQARKETEL